MNLCFRPLLPLSCFARIIAFRQILYGTPGTPLTRLGRVCDYTFMAVRDDAPQAALLNWVVHQLNHHYMGDQHGIGAVYGEKCGRWEQVAGGWQCDMSCL